ncbi:MAG: AbrB/MazE/SpoVT family DNA-binding domain-containing protein [Methanobacteriaceae archaeon]|nr:AbrB/MazE/SpoVT family DNA-binding domain-containing protein [Methanobacteriaceae archaeon]
MISSQINNNYRIQIPIEIRKKLKIKRTDSVEWKINEKGNVELEFKKESKTISLNINSFKH